MAPFANNNFEQYIRKGEVDLYAEDNDRDILIIMEQRGLEGANFLFTHCSRLRRLALRIAKLINFHEEPLLKLDLLSQITQAKILQKKIYLRHAVDVSTFQELLLLHYSLYVTVEKEYRARQLVREQLAVKVEQSNLMAVMFNRPGYILQM